MKASTKPRGYPALPENAPNPVAGRQISFYVRRHFGFGWWSLLVFLSIGIILEALHAFKIGWYLDVSNETRRLMWTLGHAHGTLLALINIAFASTLAALPDFNSRFRSLVSLCLLAATLLIPAGFILGGVFIHSGDPGLGILFLPVGAIFLLTGVFLIARGIAVAPGGSVALEKLRPGKERDS